MRYCGHCGKANDDNARFCGSCGQSLTSQNTNTSSQQNSSWVNYLNNYVGNDKPADLNWKVLFSDVLNKHTKEDAEEIFICGTRTTTPSPDNVSKTWPHPWLYGRVFLALLAAFGLLYICCITFGNINAVPGLMVVGSFTVPISALVLFIEMNAFRNVSFYDVALIFLVGGCASLVATLLLFSIVGVEQLDFIGAMTVGLIEEVGKAIIVYYFIKRTKKLNILSCMLIGAAVGAGFAAFESSGYALTSLAEGGWGLMLMTIFLRGFLTPGGHIAWAAITGAAIAIAAKERGALNGSVFTSGKFLRLFIIPVVLHGLWDSPLSNIGSQILLFPILLTLLVWVVVFILFNMGLAEIPNEND